MFDCGEIGKGEVCEKAQGKELVEIESRSPVGVIGPSEPLKAAPQFTGTSKAATDLDGRSCSSEETESLVEPWYRQLYPCLEHLEQLGLDSSHWIQQERQGYIHPNRSMYDQV
jgi:hypothetical protein